MAWYYIFFVSIPSCSNEFVATRRSAALLLPLFLARPPPDQSKSLRATNAPLRLIKSGLKARLLLDNSLELPCVAERILNDQLAHLLLDTNDSTSSLIVIQGFGGLVGEVNHAVLEDPAARAGKVDDGALGVEEEEGLGGGDG